jgi:hypothetical protein
LRPDNSHYLHAAQQAAHDDLNRRAAEAIRALDRRGERVTFASVARASGISRSFLNKVPALATEIRRLRALQSKGGVALPAGQRMSDGSKDARIRQLQESNHALRAEVGLLRDQNAILLGKLRDAR